MRVLVTAGPTREHWDNVRFLSSAATGRLGIEIAKAAESAGHECALVLGPTHLSPPETPRITVHRVVSALDMLSACRAEWEACGGLVATAAVCDFRPAERHDGKLRKDRREPVVALLPNPDILATLSAVKGTRVCVGFALQVEEAEARARGKLDSKNLDAIVLDDPSAMAVDRADFRLLLPDGTARDFPATTKAELARELVAFVTGA